MCKKIIDNRSLNLTFCRNLFEQPWGKGETLVHVSAGWDPSRKPELFSLYNHILRTFPCISSISLSLQLISWHPEYLHFLTLQVFVAWHSSHRGELLFPQCSKSHPVLLRLQPCFAVPGIPLFRVDCSSLTLVIYGLPDSGRAEFRAE